MKYFNFLKEIRFRNIRQRVKVRFFLNEFQFIEEINSHLTINFLRECSGILHIGAHVGQESAMYSAYEVPVLWIEGDPSIYKILQKNLLNFKNQTCLLALLGDTNSDSVNFFISSNNGESSSMREFNLVNQINKIDTIQTTQLPLRRLDNLLLDPSKFLYDFWIVDTQGSELEVLRGSGTLINKARVILVEVSTFEIYVGQALYSDIKVFLAQHGFSPLIEPTGLYHGNIIFSKF